MALIIWHLRTAKPETTEYRSRFIASINTSIRSRADRTLYSVRPTKRARSAQPCSACRNTKRRRASTPSFLRPTLCRRMRIRTGHWMPRPSRSTTSAVALTTSELPANYRPCACTRHQTTLARTSCLCGLHGHTLSKRSTPTPMQSSQTVRLNRATGLR